MRKFPKGVNARDFDQRGSTNLNYASIVLVAFLLCGLTAVGQSDRADDVSRWKTFSNRAGWTIKYPRNWKVSSCHSCPDPTDPNVFVAFENPKTEEIITIDHFIDKPKDQSVEQWLNDIKVTTNLNPRVSEEWVTVSKERAIMVITRNQDSTECENYYVVHESKTFAIQIDRNSSSYSLYKRILATFKFTN